MATRAWQQKWSVFSAGSLDIAKHRERTFHGAVIELNGGYRDVWWSDDGTNAGNSVFDDDDVAPLVMLLASHLKDPRLIGPDSWWGPMWVHLAGWPESQFHWDTYYDSTAALWFTRVQMTAYNTDVRVGIQNKRTFWLAALAG